MAFFLVLPVLMSASAEGPTASIVSSFSSPTNVSSVPLAITFSSAVTGFEATDIQISGPGTIDPATFNGSGSEYTIMLTLTGDGTITATIPEDSAVDGATGNGNQSGTFSIEYTLRRPNLALSPDPLPTTVTDPFEVELNSTIALREFTESAVTVTGGTVSEAHSTRSGMRHFAFTITPSGGPISISIIEGAVLSNAGNPNVASKILTTRMGPVTFTGTVWHDLDANGNHDTLDTGIQGWAITAQPVLADGTPDTSRASFSTQTGANGAYTLTFSPTLYGMWVITPVIQSSWLLLSGTSTTFTAANDSPQPAPADFGVATFITYDNASFLPVNGTADSAEAFITPPDRESVIEEGEIAGISTVRIPASTRITKTDGSHLSLTDITQLNVQSLPEGNRILSENLKWGAPGVGLTYSKSVNYSLFVGNGYDLLRVEQRPSLSSTWNFVADCEAQGGICTFQTSTSPVNPLSPIRVPTTVNPDAPTATSVSIKTSNATATSTGRVGHTVYVLFKADRSVRLPVVTIAGRVATVQITSTPNNTFSAYTTLVTGDTEGVIPFSISLTSAAGVAAASTITSTTDSTSVTFDKTPPVVSITSPAVNNTTATTTLEVLFGLNEIPQKFICKIDAAAYAPCTSPYIRTDLTSGTHTLYIYGYDLAGNASALASRSFIFRP